MVISVLAQAGGRAVAGVAARTAGKKIAQTVATNVGEAEVAEATSAISNLQKANPAIQKYVQNFPTTSTPANDNSSKRRPNDGGDIRLAVDNTKQNENTNNGNLSDEARATIDKKTQELLENPNANKTRPIPNRNSEISPQRNFNDELKDSILENENLRNEMSGLADENEEDISQTENKNANAKKFPAVLFSFTIIEYLFRAFFIISATVLFVLGFILTASAGIPIIGWIGALATVPTGTTFILISGILFTWAKIQGIATNILVNILLLRIDLATGKEQFKNSKKIVNMFGKKISLKMGMSILNTIPIIGDLFPSLPILVWKSSK